MSKTKPEEIKPVLASVPPAAEESEPQAQEKPKAKLKKVLPTPRISVSKQLDILRGYVHASGSEGKAVKLDELGAIVGMHPNTVTMANAFLADVGLIQKVGGGYMPTAPTMAYASAHAWNPETAAHKLGPTIALTWFSKPLLPKLSMRPMDESDVIADLGSEAGAGVEYKPQLRMLLEFMEETGLVQRDNGRITKRTGSTADPEPPATKEIPSSDAVAQSGGSRSSLVTSFSGPTEGVIRFNVSVKVDMAEFAGWKADRIAAFFSGIAQVLAAKGNLEQDASDV